MRIRRTEPAVRDFTGICDYIEEQDAPEAAHRVARRIYEGIESLTSFPRRGRPGIRESVIEINRILHGAQNWP